MRVLYLSTPDKDGKKELLLSLSTRISEDSNNQLTVEDKGCFDIDADYFECIKRGTAE